MLFNGFMLFGMEDPYLKEYTTVMRIENRIFLEAENITAQHKQKGASIVLEKMRDQHSHNEYQTSQGYFLEVKHEMPLAIYWMLGRKRFIKGNSVLADGDKLLLERLKEVLGLELLESKKRPLTSSGNKDVLETVPTYTYKIKNIDGELLPNPQFKSAEDYISVDEAKKIVKKLCTM